MESFSGGKFLDHT